MTQSLLTGAIRTKFSVTGATMRRRHAETKQSPNTNFAAVCPAIHLRVRATAAKAEFGILHFSEVSVGPPVAGVNPRPRRSALQRPPHKTSDQSRRGCCRGFERGSLEQ